MVMITVLWAAWCSCPTGRSGLLACARATAWRAGALWRSAPHPGSSRRCSPGCWRWPCAPAEYLADASAVEYTRNPLGLARALERFATPRCARRAGRGTAHLFLVNPVRGLNERGGFADLLGTHPPIARADHAAVPDGGRA
jgi:hypothetical protein